MAATSEDCRTIVFCGVHFMAETAKLLNPDRKVVIPDMAASCSLAEGCPADELRAFIDEHEGAAVLSYINTTAEVKALSDLICTSANAVEMAKSLGDRPIILPPGLGANLRPRNRVGPRD